MRIDEIISDNESDVYNALRTLHFILVANATISVKTLELQQLIDNQIAALYADRANLNAFILSSERINDMYNKILQQLP